MSKQLPSKPPYPPMEALLVDEIPAGPDWQYEPKWDGFRCLVFRDGAKVELQSKSGRPLTRYFPEIVAAAKTLPAKKFVLDGEIAVPDGRVFSFDALLQRIHPAASRIARLAGETPALMIVFDLLADADGRFRWQAIRESRTFPALARHRAARRGQGLAQTSRRDPRRHHRETPR